MQLRINLIILVSLISLISQAQTYTSGNSNISKLGVAPNCNETTMSPQDFIALGKDPSITDIVDFQKKLPKNSFQTFTLIYRSLSAQKGYGDSQVRCEWPRVVRTSIDGKLTYSYTCDPKSSAYGTVEVISIDDDDQPVMSSINLKASEIEGHHARVKVNDKSCVECHSYSNTNGKPNLKYNWQEYFAWSDCKENRGIKMFGGFDDGMQRGNARRRSMTSKQSIGSDCTPQEDDAALKQEVDCFARFKETQKNNPCYADLPWADTSKSDPQTQNYYSMYPYAASEPSRGKLDLETRPNLRITNVFAMRNANRLSSLFQKHPKFEAVKYYLMMEGLGCPSSKMDDENFQRLIGNKFESVDRKEYGSIRTGFASQVDIQAKHPRIFKYAESIGLKPGDWSLEFNTPNNPFFREVIPTEGASYSRGTSEVVFSKLFDDLSVKTPELSQYSGKLKTKGFEDIWGKQFACLDKVASTISTRFNGNPEICRKLKELNDRQLDAHLKLCESPDALSSSTKSAERVVAQVQEMKKEFDITSVRRGEHVANKNCASCHSTNGIEALAQSNSNLFIADTIKGSSADRDLAIKRLRARYQQPDFRKGLIQHLQSGSMPEYGQKLSAEEQADIMNYLDSLAQ